MKITCDIVRDLMPLYVDDVCSDDSRKLIEDHINHCSKCQNELAAMKDPIECPPLSEAGDSKTPFSKIRKKVRIKMIAAIISTAFLVMTAMFAIQEVGVLHDFFMPMDIAFIDNNHGSDEWFQVHINDGDYLIFSSVFYKKEVINDINNPYDITIRILDENQTIVLKDTTIKLGESINLHCLKYNKNYIVQVKCKPGRYNLNFT